MQPSEFTPILSYSFRGSYTSHPGLSSTCSQWIYLDRETFLCRRMQIICSQEIAAYSATHRELYFEFAGFFLFLKVLRVQREVVTKVEVKLMVVFCFEHQLESRRRTKRFLMEDMTFCMDDSLLGVYQWIYHQPSPHCSDVLLE